jgi:hypothetical protein
MKIKYVIILAFCVNHLNAQTLINKDNSQIFVGTNLMSLFPPDMFAEAFATLNYEPSALQISVQGGPLVRSLAPPTFGLPNNLSDVVQTNNGGMRSRLNISTFKNDKFFVGFQYQYKQLNTTHKYWQNYGSIRRIADHDIVKVKHSFSIETGFYKVTESGQFFQISFSAGMAYRNIKVNGEPLVSSTESFIMPSFEEENLLPQMALIIRTGFCVYGKK